MYDIYKNITLCLKIKHFNTMILNIGKKIQELRQSKKLTQADLAKQVGLSRSAVTFIEQNKRKVTVEEMLKFCEVFGCSYQDFLSSAINDNSFVADKPRKKNPIEVYNDYKKYKENYIDRDEAERRNKGEQEFARPETRDEYLKRINPYYFSDSEIYYERRT